MNAPAPTPAPAQSPALFLFSRTDTGPLTLPLTTHVLSPYRPQYDHHAVTLETVAAVPGVVGAAHRHLRSLRCMKRDHGWINPLQEEAENERMHLLIWMQHTKPTSIERAFVMMAQVSPSPRRGVMWRIAGPTQPRRTTELTPGTSPHLPSASGNLRCRVQVWFTMVCGHGFQFQFQFARAPRPLTSVLRPPSSRDCACA